ncbi:voltage-dependent L-type calcium channel subunit alpha-1S isoform 2, partial [Reticulomyxa filosa]
TNFDTFASSFSLLYQVATQDNWDAVYAAYLEAYRGTHHLYSVYIFFISFFVFGTAVLINLFIAVVLDAFQENKDSFMREEKLETIKVWRNLWLWFEPEAKGKISADMFLTLLRLSPRPTGFCRYNPFEKLMFLTLQMKKLKRKKSAHNTSTRTLPGLDDNVDANSPASVSTVSPNRDSAHASLRKSNSFVLSRHLLSMIPMSGLLFF